MIGRARSRRVLARLAPAVVVLTLAACASPGDRAACAEVYVPVIEAVEGVESVDAECSARLDGGWAQVNVYLTTNDKDEALATADRIERAMAAAPELEPGWYTPSTYWFQDGTGYVAEPVTVGDLREK
ncbi:hypothetical protein [Myceligenerans crystallogenes]|uniref:Lipoprotein n=1 Tax=Myceligenerans crystallogenes TaxID=316335 RepID=A0ABN2N488_9MICO